MNLIDIAKNAPEGATHYTESTDSELFAYWRNGGLSVFLPCNGHWQKSNQSIESFQLRRKLIPKVNEDWNEIKSDAAVSSFESHAGFLYSAPDKSQKYADLQDYINNLDENGFSNLYLLVETVVDERQEFIDGLDDIYAEYENLPIKEILGKMFDSERYKMVSEDE